MENRVFTKEVDLFHGRKAPEKARLVGYGAVIEAFQLPVPLPDTLSLISLKRRNYRSDGWVVHSSKAFFEDTLYKHLVFSLKYEGVNLLFFKKLFEHLETDEVLTLLGIEPTGKYTRKIWFLYEWLMDRQLDKPDLTIKNYEPLVNERIQYALSSGEYSSRHRIINNLPGTRYFCPLIHKTEKLEAHIQSNLAAQNAEQLKGVRKDLMQRASAFLLLKDSKASFTIEGENPKSRRAARWGEAIGQAGSEELTREELVRLQQIVIEDDRFTEMGFRTKGGFVGEHDRTTGEPVPEHISARWQDLDLLTEGLIATNKKLLDPEMDAVLAAASVAFGFVFIHPFEDGNGRIHRFLIHHLLARKKFSQQGIIFPVSASILDHIDDYRDCLVSYSKPLLNFIEWKETLDHNVEVLNETADYYRYFDATKQAEFLYFCVADTIRRIIPEEVLYLGRYDQFKQYIDHEFDMPDRMVALLVRFLEQNGGKLSKRARTKEFKKLKDKEADSIEERFREIF